LDSTDRSLIKNRFPNIQCIVDSKLRRPCSLAQTEIRDCLLIRETNFFHYVPGSGLKFYTHKLLTTDNNIFSVVKWYRRFCDILSCFLVTG